MPLNSNPYNGDWIDGNGIQPSKPVKMCEICGDHEADGTSRICLGCEKLLGDLTDERIQEREYDEKRDNAND
jgi:hypothetical protein